MLGYSGPAEKALIMRIAQALLNPGRIGLIAVDSLAVGVPILATDWKFHAPEYDYLTPGRDVVESENTVDAFSGLVARTVSVDRFFPEHVAKSYPSLDQMVGNFTRGVQRMFD